MTAKQLAEIVGHKPEKAIFDGGLVGWRWEFASEGGSLVVRLNLIPNEDGKHRIELEPAPWLVRRAFSHLSQWLRFC